MEFVAGIVFTLFLLFIATRVLRKKYEVVEREQPPTGSGGGGRVPTEQGTDILHK